MSVHDAEPNDIYADANGKLWRVIGICREPTVTVEEVEPSGHSSDPPQLVGIAAAQGIAQLVGPVKGQFIRRRQGGGVGGLMWNGFKRVFRPETHPHA